MPASTIDPILAKRQLGEINRGLAAVNAAIQECDLAENCGNNCQERRDALELMRQDFLRFKTTYFPDSR